MADAAVDALVSALEGAALFVLPLAAWLLFRGATAPPPHPVYARPGWNFFLKRWWARCVLWRRRGRRRARALGVGLVCVAANDPQVNPGPADHLLPTHLEEELESPKELTSQEMEDSTWLWGSDARTGAMLVVRLDRRWRRAAPTAWLMLRLTDGHTYTLPKDDSAGRRRPLALEAVSGAGAVRRAWSAQGLRLELLEPFRHWRVRFNGLLTRYTDGGNSEEGVNGEVEAVSFSFMWRAASNPVELQADWDCALLADSLAKEPWRNGRWPSLVREWGDGYDQWGTLRGSVRLGGGAACALHLRGLRRRRWGVRPALWTHRCVCVSAWAPGAGRRVALVTAASASGGGASHAAWGHVQEVTGAQACVSAADLSLHALAEHPDAPPAHFTLRLEAGGRHYALDAYPLPHCAQRLLTGDGLLKFVAPFVCTLSNVQAQGVLEIWYRTEAQLLLPPGPRRLDALEADDSVFLEAEEDAEAEALRAETVAQAESLMARGLARREGMVPLLLWLEERACRKESLVGGKGASLAEMHALHLTQARVPQGFCVTAAAFRLHKDRNPLLLNAIRQLGKASADASERAAGSQEALDALKRACERTEQEMKEAPISGEIRTSIKSALDRLLASNKEGAEVLVAVRSSALGEDSEELSAAGQNATFLGLRRPDDVLDAVARCWASLYAFQSVEYRRQHGQPVDVGMGVVVQAMVAAEKAGVLFTHHPATASPHQMLITANYGLGETVVSAQAEPDSIVVARDLRGTLSIAELTCGSKRIRMRMAEDGEIRTERLDDNTEGGAEEGRDGSKERVEREGEEGPAQELCLSHEEILRLAELGLVLEAAFASPRDIEWAIAKGEVYLLQSRPITSLDQWSDFELLHEFDSPIAADTDLATLGNTGEVFPKMCSPLALSTVVPVLDQGMSKSLKVTPMHYYPRHLTVTHNRILLNMHTTVYSAIEEKQSIGFKVSEIAIFGHPVTTSDFHQYGLERNGPMSVKKKILNVVNGIKSSLRNKAVASKSEMVMDSIQLHKTKYTTPEILYLSIGQSLKKIKEIADCHNSTSSVSVFSQVVAMSILTEGAEELTTEHYSDIALLLSSCSDVVSAEVPTDIKDLANTIARTGRAQEFCSLPTDLAVEWMEANLEVSKKYKNFLQKHGHRGIMEFDVMSETWEMNPAGIVSTLQTMAEGSDGQPPTREPPLSPEDTVARFTSVQSDKTRSVLGLLLPWCRATVAQRELTKAALIGGLHRLRLSYRRLAVMLVRDGRLPDAGLVFFLSHYELGQLIDTRSPLLLAKAQRRRRLWSQWEQHQFPEMVLGLPEPINAASRQRREGDGKGGAAARLKGTPVWAGTVMGRACVVLHLSEISQLRRGDILITRSTDIGWSPYFPMLGGVVTELGGLISHGAVVAREYGLPCIVGAAGATDMFTTGETVLLVGENGTLEKVDS